MNIDFHSYIVIPLLPITDKIFIFAVSILVFIMNGRDSEGGQVNQNKKAPL